MERRIFVGNLPTSDMEKKDLEDIFSIYGNIIGQYLGMCNKVGSTEILMLNNLLRLCLAMQ